MRAVVPIEYGTLEINYMWLPTAIGMNAVLKQEMEKILAEKMKGRTMSEFNLDIAHDTVVEFLEERFPDIKGLGRYLDAMKYLEIRR